MFSLKKIVFLDALSDKNPNFSEPLFLRKWIIRIRNAKTHAKQHATTYALFGSGAFLSDTLSDGLVGLVTPAGLVKPAGLVGVVALNLFTGAVGLGVFCTNCFSFAFFSSSAAFLKKAMRSFTEPMPPFWPNLEPWEEQNKYSGPYFYHDLYNADKMKQQGIFLLHPSTPPPQPTTPMGF